MKAVSGHGVSFEKQARKGGGEIQLQRSRLTSNHRRTKTQSKNQNQKNQNKENTENTENRENKENKENKKCTSKAPARRP
jgi:hypothetical protein